MSDTVWISGVGSNSSLFENPGLREKHSGEEWHPATINRKLSSEKVHKSIQRHGKGHCLEREEMPEAAAVFDQKRFKRTKDFFAIGGFYAVKGKLAQLLSQCDLGEGGLVPIPFYEADLMTPLEGEYFLLNFGARKNCFLPGQSRHVTEIGVDPRSGVKYWDIPAGYKDRDTALSPTALKGADLWFEETVWSRIFMKDNVVQAIAEAGLTEEFRLKQCRIVEAQS